jgi:AcrR family transcriptional regulator
MSSAIPQVASRAEMDTEAPPLTEKGQATRARLLNAAREQALENDGTLELAAVAEAAGVVPSVVYRYFGSKAGLVTALIDDFFDRLHERVLDLDLTQHGSWAERERHRMELGVRLHYEEPLAVVLYARLAREPEVAIAQAERTRAVVEQAARNIRHGQRCGELPAELDPRLAGATIFGAFKEVLVEALGRARRPAPERVIDLLWRQVEAAVQIKPHQRRSR